MLTRNFFLLFTGGFSLALLLKQAIKLIVDRKNQTINWILLSTFGIYLIIQLIFAWSELEQRQIASFKYAFVGSTVLYSISICATLYISMQRVICFYPSGWIQRYISKIVIALPAILFATRLVRTILIFTTGNTTFFVIPILQLVTFFPVMIFRSIFDIASLLALYQITRNSESFFQIDDRTVTKRAMNTMMLSLSFEIFISLFALFVAILEAMKYQGDMVSFVDWLMIAWCISSSIDQRELYRIIFRTSSTDASTTGTANKTSRIV